MEEYIHALEKMKRSPRDRLGILGELGVTGLGVTTGIAISGTVAGAAGAATLAGSTTLASLLGGVFVTTTPVGWIVGSAVVCGSLAYSLGKRVRSGSKFDTIKAQAIKDLESRIAAMKKGAELSQDDDEKMANVITTIQYLVVNRCLTQDKGTEILAAVEKKSLDIDEAFERLQGLLIERHNGDGNNV
ncbi:MAG: hypothetical protein ACR65O_09600 [Methylomicrobium sp.]|jgi:hypothetical protein